MLFWHLSDAEGEERKKEKSVPNFLKTREVGGKAQQTQSGQFSIASNQYIASMESLMSFITYNSQNKILQKKYFFGIRTAISFA